MNSNWIAGIGQFEILGVSWGAIAIFYWTLSWKLGKAVRSESDGCLLMICNSIFLGIGGSLGLKFFPFPFNLLCSMFLALILPTIVTLSWHRRMKTRKGP